MLGQHGEMVANKFRPKHASIQKRKAVARMQSAVAGSKSTAAFGFFREFAHDETVWVTIDQAANVIQYLNILG